MTIRLIGLSGYAQSGKDSVGKILVEHHGFTRAAFADRMREMAIAINPIVDWSNEGLGGRPVRLDEIITAVGWERAKQNQEVRVLLQRIGTDAGRELLGSDVWVKATFNQMTPRKSSAWVITDVRFPNEAAAIFRRDGLVMRITRPGAVPANGHVSERALDNYPFDYTLDNEGTLDDLELAVNEIMADLAGARK